MRTRILLALRLGWAVTLLAYARRRPAVPDRRIEVTAAYLLAGRELVESLAAVLARDGRPLRWPSDLDALHALSMVPVAIVSPRLRRPAAASGSVAFVLALLSR